MTKQNYFTLGRKLMFLLIALLVMTACKKDDNNDDNNDPPPAAVNPMVGTYAFVAATFNAPITVIVNGDTNNYAVGDDAFLFVGGGLLGAAPCDNADNAALELRDNFISYYICQNESNESQQGTWSSNDDYSTLTLNIANPATFSVGIIEVDLSNDMLKGKIINLPMPYDTSLPVGDPLPGGGINFQIANVSVEFIRL